MSIDAGFRHNSKAITNLRPKWRQRFYYRDVWMDRGAKVVLHFGEDFCLYEHFGDSRKFQREEKSLMKSLVLISIGAKQ